MLPPLLRSRVTPTGWVFLPEELLSWENLKLYQLKAFHTFGRPRFLVEGDHTFPGDLAKGEAVVSEFQGVRS
jgi:hypothetical protein